MTRSDKDHFVLQTRLLVSPDAERKLEQRFFIGWRMNNIAVKYARHQLQQLHENKTYRATLAAYRTAKDDAKKQIKEQLNNIIASYHISEYDLQHFLILQQHKYKKFIDSMTSQKIASNVSKGVSKILYSNGKILHCNKYNTFNSLEGKNNTTGICLKDDGGWHIEWLGLNIPLSVREKDILLQKSLSENAISYCGIVRKPFKCGYRYFVQIIFQGSCPAKSTRKKSPGKRVGTDIGTSTVAATNGDKCVLKQLAAGVEKYNKEIEALSEQLEHKRRVNNPNNFNDDGSIKHGVKLTWNNSRNYNKTLWKLRDAYRRRSAFILQSHNILANEILLLGNNIYTEQMNFKALAKKAKETQISEKTGLPKSKKRFGKSIESRAPGLFTEILARKLKAQHKELHKVNTKTFKASQYNHITDKYTKKELSDRHCDIDGQWVQRDLYSAFLLRNSQSDLKHTDRDSCLKLYPKFKKAHDLCIKRIKKTGQQVPSSFGF